MWLSFIKQLIKHCKLRFFDENYYIRATIENNIDNISAPIVTIRNSNFNQTDRAVGGSVPLWCGASYQSVRQLLASDGVGCFRTNFVYHKEGTYHKYRLLFLPVRVSNNHVSSFLSQKI